MNFVSLLRSQVKDAISLLCCSHIQKGNYNYQHHHHHHCDFHHQDCYYYANRRMGAEEATASVEDSAEGNSCFLLNSNSPTALGAAVTVTTTPPPTVTTAAVESKNYNHSSENSERGVAEEESVNGSFHPLKSPKNKKQFQRRPSIGNLQYTGIGGLKLGLLGVVEGYLSEVDTEHEEGCSCDQNEVLNDNNIKGVKRVRLGIGGEVEDFNGRYRTGGNNPNAGNNNACGSSVILEETETTAEVADSSVIAFTSGERVDRNIQVENGESGGDCCAEGGEMGAASVIEEEWHQKYAFIVGLLRKPHVILVKDSLTRERDKLCNKLSAYRLERNIVRESINKFIQNGSDTSASHQSLTAQIKHLDYMCVTLERQIDVLGNVDHAIPVTDNIYSGEPDSLDGTSSEIMPVDDDADDDDFVDSSRRQHLSNNSTSENHHLHRHNTSNPMSGIGGMNRSGFSNHTNINSSSGALGGSGPGFHLQINGRSPLDALAMLHLERCAHRETRKELNQLRKKYELLRDEFDSGEGLSQSTSLLFSRLNGDLESDDIFCNLNTSEENSTDEVRVGGGACGRIGGRCGESIGSGTSSCNGSSSGGGRVMEAVRLKEFTISQLRNRLLHLEKARMDKVPVDTAREIARLHSALIQLERVRDELTLQNFTLKSKLAELSARISDSATYRLEKPLNANDSNKKSKTSEESEKDEASSTNSSTSPSLSPMNGVNPNSTSAFSDEGVGGVNSAGGLNGEDLLRLRRKSTYKISHNNETNGEIKQLRSLINDLHQKELEYQKKLSGLETELCNLKNQYGDEVSAREESERIVREVEEQLELAQRKLEDAEKAFLGKEEEASAIKLDLDTLNEENRRLKDDLNLLHLKVEKEQSKSIEKLSRFEKELSQVMESNRSLLEECQKERVLRKKFYNVVEELKGKIRVFCRIRPQSKTERLSGHGGAGLGDIVVKPSDPYTISVDSQRGYKEFQFDRVFTPDDSQDEVFADTRNLIQSAFDGYNVCICAYGQTGSGKTYTILGDEAHPGIAPRTFSEIFRVADERSSAYDTCVSFYMLELYNDRLIDLLGSLTSSSSTGNSSVSSGTISGFGEGGSTSSSGGNPDKLEIRRDRRGTVWVSGARVFPAEDSSSLERSFRQALTARHTACTRMNDRSSRSHLILSLIVETTSKVNGTVLRGKISLVDLAGSERTGKSGVSADTLREANAINKSLSAFGDVINALTTDQAFVPYRNNKLTLLMQDSIGGNAKTLMFVNVSPSGYNLEETLISLGYGQRLKQVTNGATRNSESREVARLKNIIQRLRRGEMPSEVDEALTQ